MRDDAPCLSHFCLTECMIDLHNNCRLGQSTDIGLWSDQLSGILGLVFSANAQHITSVRRVQRITLNLTPLTVLTLTLFENLAKNFLLDLNLSARNKVDLATSPVANLLDIQLQCSIYRPRSRGDNTFGSDRVSVRLTVGTLLFDLFDL